MTENAGTVTPLDGTAAPSPGRAGRRPARRRRPTGAPPPLPHPVSVTATAWLVLAVAVLADAILVSVRAPSLRLDDQVNAAVLRLFARARTPWLTGIARGISVAGSDWGVTAVGLSVVALTMAFRRWRHLLIFGCSLAFLELAGYWINRELTRPRPYDVPIIAGWAKLNARLPRSYDGRFPSDLRSGWHWLTGTSQVRLHASKGALQPALSPPG